jgi:hypothetical protein
MACGVAGRTDSIARDFVVRGGPSVKVWTVTLLPMGNTRRIALTGNQFVRVEGLWSVTSAR